MRDVVIVTSYKREELLWLCLEAIRREDPKIKIRVYSDRGYDSPDLRSCILEFEAGLVVRGEHDHFGNSFNLVYAMDQELRAGADVLHVIEEDTILHGGYLEWARAKLRSKKFACVCGRLCEVPNWYESPCVSWDAGFLMLALDYIHARPEYLTQKTRQDMVKICDEIFPKSKFRRGGGEQDGFFLRVIENRGWSTAFPEDPLCSHLGFWGYNRPNGDSQKPTGPLEDRIEICRQLLHDLPRRIGWFGGRVANREWAGMTKGKT